MKFTSTLVIATVVMVGCAQSSGIQKLGRDTYSPSVFTDPARGGEPAARNLALTEAIQAYAREGKEILVSNVSSDRPSRLPGGRVDVTFRCLFKWDPDLQRPN